MGWSDFDVSKCLQILSLLANRCLQNAMVFILNFYEKLFQYRDVQLWRSRTHLEIDKNLWKITELIPSLLVNRCLQKILTYLNNFGRWKKETKILWEDRLFDTQPNLQPKWWGIWVSQPILRDLLRNNTSERIPLRGFLCHLVSALTNNIHDHLIIQNIRISLCGSCIEDLILIQIFLKRECFISGHLWKGICQSWLVIKKN